MTSVPWYRRARVLVSAAAVVPAVTLALVAPASATPQPATVSDVAVSAVAAADAVAESSADGHDHPRARPHRADPARGLVHRGLKKADKGACKGMFKVVGTSMCSHGRTARRRGSP